MKFDPRAMEALLALDDRALWEKIRGIAAASGIPLTDTVPPHADLEKLRDMMRGSGQGNVAEALSTLSRYRVRKCHE